MERNAISFRLNGSRFPFYEERKQRDERNNGGPRCKSRFCEHFLITFLIKTPGPRPLSSVASVQFLGIALCFNRAANKRLPVLITSAFVSSGNNGPSTWRCIFQTQTFTMIRRVQRTFACTTQILSRSGCSQVVPSNHEN